MFLSLLWTLVSQLEVKLVFIFLYWLIMLNMALEINQNGCLQKSAGVKHGGYGARVRPSLYYNKLACRSNQIAGLV